VLELIDLHTHSRWSDGVLAPAELVERAARRSVQLLALTDHDTVGGCAEAQRAAHTHGVRFIAGTELTAGWRGREVHVVGLRVRLPSAELERHCAQMMALRHERIVAMAQRLTRAGLPGEALAAGALAIPAPTRTHLARALCEQGFSKDRQQAFDRWLGRGRPGYVEARWPELAEVVAHITAAGGLAVLAHPHRYALSGGELRALVDAFKQAGGAGIEVSVSGMSPKAADRAASLARRFALAGSIGSDFHEPDLPWRPLGRFAKLPEGITPIAACLD
jgi:predicted metal-dependent phosphoesterase TrpH